MMQFQKRVPEADESVERGWGGLHCGRSNVATRALYTERKVETRPTPVWGMVCSLTFLENSPPMWINSQLLVPDARLPITPLGKSSFMDVALRSSDGKTKLKPTISVRLMSRVGLGLKRRYTHLPCEVTLTLESASNAMSLQYSGNSYIGTDVFDTNASRRKAGGNLKKSMLFNRITYVHYTFSRLHLMVDLVSELLYD
ncbi:hypothetical protein PM082_023834 [Marasmius tenuissimus]|nr:hypothetical protein PM082_023834 [Marasmius tenuissimus]